MGLVAYVTKHSDPWRKMMISGVDKKREEEEEQHSVYSDSHVSTKKVNTHTEKDPPLQHPRMCKSRTRMSSVFVSGLKSFSGIH